MSDRLRLRALLSGARAVCSALLLPLLLLLPGTPPVSGQTGCQPLTGAGVTLSVGAMANIFGAGHATPPDPGGSGGGTLPPCLSLPPGAAQALTFPSVSGSVAFDTTDPPVGPDGGPGCCGGTDVPSTGGIAGIRDDQEFFLAGVFVGPAEPSDPAPPVHDFTGQTSFPSLSPLLNQTFFIGDGLTGTGSGSVQQFVVPAGATRLYLGFADANAFHNSPGFYSDNSGQLSVTVALAGANRPSAGPSGAPPAGVPPPAAPPAGSRVSPVVGVLSGRSGWLLPRRS